MILLYGRSPSGKTEFFLNQFKGKETRILHASSLPELRNHIAMTESPMEYQLPTLINTWFDLDCKTIRDLEGYEVYIEAHYMENKDDLKEVGSRFYGLKNENFIRERKRFIQRNKDAKDNYDWISLLGTRYHYFQSAFPDRIK